MNHTLNESAWQAKHRMRRGHPEMYCCLCRGAGKSLTKNCVGRMLTNEEESLIAKGELTFFDGRWSDSPTAADVETSSVAGSAPDRAYTIRGWVPPGWSCKQYPRQQDVVVITRDGEGGMVSLDFKLRVWNSGFQLPRSFPEDVERDYSGRGWRHRMVNDACAWLERAMRPRGARAVEQG